MSYHSPATLPQELIDLIVEELGLKRDTKSLIACLTVSRAFFPMARACLWRDRFLGPYRQTSKLGCVRWSRENLPKCPVLRPLVRSMRLDTSNWSWNNAEPCLQDLSTLVDVFKRVDHLEFNDRVVSQLIMTSPVVAKWHIVSLKVMYLGVGLHGVAAKSCAVFENFPFLIDLKLNNPVSFVEGPLAACMAHRHHKLPQPVSLSLTLRRSYNSTDQSHVHSCIRAGHLFSSKKLRTIEVDYTEDLDGLLASTSDTVKEFVVRPLPSEHDHDQRLFSFHRAESILFPLDTKQKAREMLLWWTRVMIHNDSNNTVQKVAIEIQLHLDPKRRSPKICFPEVWKEFRTALGGLLALNELMIIYQPGDRDRIGNLDDAATRAKVTKFLRGKLGAVGDPTRVRLAFIDRNV